MVFLTFFSWSLNIAWFCLSIASRSPPTTPRGCGAKTHNLRTVTLSLCLAFHMISCVSLIKSLNLSCLIWKMGIMMIVPPSRLHVCLQRASGPERAFWLPESGTNMNYSATWEKEIFCLEVMAAIRKAKYWCFWTLTQNSEPMLLFSGLTKELIITVSDYSLPQPYESAFPCQLLLPWNHTASKVVKVLALLSVYHISSIARSSCYGYFS